MSIEPLSIEPRITRKDRINGLKRGLLIAVPLILLIFAVILLLSRNNGFALIDTETGRSVSSEGELFFSCDEIEKAFGKPVSIERREAGESAPCVIWRYDGAEFMFNPAYGMADIPEEDWKCYSMTVDGSRFRLKYGNIGVGSLKSLVSLHFHGNTEIDDQTDDSVRSYLIGTKDAPSAITFRFDKEGKVITFAVTPTA